MRRFCVGFAPAVFALAVAGCPGESGTMDVGSQIGGLSIGGENSGGNQTVTAGEVVTEVEGETVVAGTGGESENSTLDSGDAFTGVNAAVAEQMLVIVNDERAAAGLPALSHNQQLNNAAQGHAADMAVNDFFSHTGSDGSNISLRADRAGYDWGFVGENIAFGPAEADAVMVLWMESPGHRANILNENFTEIGIGIDFTTGTRYWVQNFGRQR